MDSKGLCINMKKTKFLVSDDDWMSFSNLASTPELSAVVVSAETSSCAHSVQYGPKIFAFVAAGATRRLAPEAGSACKRRLVAL